MTPLSELSNEYRASGLACKNRVKELCELVKDPKLSETERMRLHSKITTLDGIARETLAIANYLRKQYGEDADE